MDKEELLRGLVEANFHRGGIKCLKLFRVRDDFFAELKKEVLLLAEHNHPSAVQAQQHVTNWTKPIGTATQYSLLNVSGKLDDTSSDHTLTIQGKKFHQAEAYPAIAKFISSFAHAINMRLNGMGHKSGLSPHEEHILHRRSGSANRYYLRARFHLPIQTTKECEMFLDDDLYHFEEGFVYFFNNGSVHSARNNSTTAYRYHLVWDMLLTKETYDLMFGDGMVPAFLERLPAAEWSLAPTRHEPQKEYQTSGPGLNLYRKFRLEKAGVKPWQFQNAYNAVAYRMPRSVGYADPP